MSRKPGIVAELGRPETPQETADRKAESSRVYRSSQSFRNLIAALLVTVAVVAVIVLAVPRGEPTTTPPIDVAKIAADVASTSERPVIVPETGDFWRVNAARLEGGATRVWSVTLAPAGEKERGFIKLGQAFDADVTWAPQVTGGMAPTGTEDIDGITWDVFDLGDRGSANVTYALGTQAGHDYVLIYGSRSADSTKKLAESLTAQLSDLKEAG
ncbi:DUF4245 family protein [Microbacterium suwonense]|uniref:DUF4245 domain-containing protein n=1 Tax=Microbacterium suwonense TaxID=683047 RepID=A0ABM8FTC7_9MICO|nr:DUF4245 family protein [Microbacterium suwonense]BDZ38932.1 hypothetical protein GCM10025863_15460 [Microbacterium suwonense]